MGIQEVIFKLPKAHLLWIISLALLKMISKNVLYRDLSHLLFADVILLLWLTWGISILLSKPSNKPLGWKLTCKNPPSLVLMLFDHLLKKQSVFGIVATHPFAHQHLDTWTNLSSTIQSFLATHEPVEHCAYGYYPKQPWWSFNLVYSS